MDEDDDDHLSMSAANAYAEAVATESIKAYIEQTTKVAQNNTGGITMPNTNGISEAATAVITETQTNAAIISGEILLENIETIADKLILSRLGFWKRLTISKANREIAVTLATYAIVHAIKTGGFGLTKYTINHTALDYVTLAANARLLKYVMRSAGVDTNIAKMLLTAPTVSAGE